METKRFIWIGVFVGSAIGSFIPSLWGAGLFSFSSMALSGVGAFAGIWLGYQVSRRF